MILLLIGLLLIASAGDVSGQETEALKRAALLRVRIHMERAEWDRAEAELLDLAQRFPQDRYIQNDLATVYRGQGRSRDAEAIYRKLLARHPQAEGYRQDLAYLLADEGRFEEVVALLEPLSKDLVVRDAPLVSLLADAHYRLGNLEEAERLYRSLLRGRDRADLIPTLLLIGEGYLGQDRLERARSFFQQALDTDPQNYRALKGMAVSLSRDDPPQARDYLLKALSLDASDFEVPYLLGESLYGSSPKGAAMYYYESLRRLEKIGVTTNYQKGLQARMLHRTGRPRQAEALYREMISQNPGNVGAANDLAEMLIDRKRYGDALKLLLSGEGMPAGSASPATVRSGLLRARIYVERGRWKEAVRELRPLVVAYPSDGHLKLDLAEGLEKTGDWAGALDIHDSLLAAGPRGPAAERAYEMRRELRRLRGTALGIDFDHTGFSDGETYRFRPSVRIYLRPQVGISLDGAEGYGRDRANFEQIDFKGWVGEYGGALHLGGATGRAISASVRHYVWRVDGHFAFGGKARLRTGRGAGIELEGSWKNVWTGPVDAVIYEGLFDGVSGSFYLPLVDRWYLSGSGTWRRFWIFRDRYFGDDRRGSVNLGWAVIRRPYGASGALRSITLNGGYERSRARQEEAFVDRIDLQDRSGILTANLTMRFLFKCRGSLDLWAYTGQDAERDIDFGKLFGVGGRLHVDMTSRLSFFAEGVYASESLVQEQAGGYREVRAGLAYHAKPRKRERR